MSYLTWTLMMPLTFSRIWTSRERLRSLNVLDHETSEDVKLLWSYDDDEIGSCMTTNYICIHNDLTIRQAMRELIRQAGENDNISTIYVVDEQDKYYGAIDLKDLIVARDTDTLESIISRSYPYLLDNEKDR
mgnify:CR=1 FL=1